MISDSISSQIEAFAGLRAYAPSAFLLISTHQGFSLGKATTALVGRLNPKDCHFT